MTESISKSSVRHFLRIPGLGDDRASATLLVDGETISVGELVRRLLLPEATCKSRAINILEQVSSPSRSDIHTIANAFYSLSSDSSYAEAPRCEEALNNFLIANASHPEAISIGAQLLRARSTHVGSTLPGSNQLLIEALRAELEALSPLAASTTKHEIIEKRYILFRAFEVDQLSLIAIRHISDFLRDTTPALASDRKTFAGQFLSAMRVRSLTEDAQVELRRVASCVFATGYLSSASRPPPPPQVAAAKQSPSSEQSSTEALNSNARSLIENLLADNRQEFVPRLMPQDFQVLRQVTGLTLEVFRLLTERIRRRAASDPWARIAILDLVRSPHEPEVTARVRTAVLGALVNDARRVGKLSAQLEKEVFAISAEIPDLPFLHHDRTNGEEHEEGPLTASQG